MHELGSPGHYSLGRKSRSHTHTQICLVLPQPGVWKSQSCLHVPSGILGCLHRMSLDFCQHGLFSCSIAFFTFFISASIFIAVAPGALKSWRQYVHLVPLPSGPPPPRALGRWFLLCLVMELSLHDRCVSPHASIIPQQGNALVLIIYGCIKNYPAET